MRNKLFILSFLFLILGASVFAQTIQNDQFKTIGYLKSDGKVQDDKFKTIGYAKGIPQRWAAVYFFFFKFK